MSKMNQNVIKTYRKMVERWDYLCIICGREFTNLNCVTREHIMPKSLVGSGRQENIAPSHYNCNKLRGTESLLTAQMLIEVKRQRFKTVAEFEAWLNQPVPDRKGMSLIQLPPRSIRRQCFDLPERLPGM